MLQSRSVFVKNLNFKTADESLKKHFSDHMKEGRILSARVIILVLRTFNVIIHDIVLIFWSTSGHMQVKKHMKNGKNVSMGFGFIEFDYVETALNVCRDLQVLTDFYQNYLHTICSFGNLLQLSHFLFFRELCWMGMLLSCNFVMLRRMSRRRKKLGRIRVQPNYL